MSRTVTVNDMSVDDFNRFKATVKAFPHPRAAAREVFKAGLDALAGKVKKASPVDVTTAATPVTPEDAPAALGSAKRAKKASTAKAPAKKAKR